MKPVTIRLSEDTIAAAEKLYGAKVTGAQIAVEGYFEIQKRTIRELQNKFSDAEIKAIADNLNGTMLQAQFQARAEMLWSHLEDGNEYEGLFAKWGVDSNTFKTKVLNLTSAQTYFIQDAVSRFWNNTTAIKDLDDLITILNPKS
jgi:hypothetical protein